MTLFAELIGSIEALVISNRLRKTEAGMPRPGSDGLLPR